MLERYDDAQLQTLRDARKTRPDLSQRALASHIHARYETYPSVAARSRQSIYGALRRVEKQVASAVTAGLAAAREPALA